MADNRKSEDVLGERLTAVLSRLKEELVILDDIGHNAGAAWLSQAIDIIEADLQKAQHGND